MEELVEKSIREGKILDKSKFRSIYEYSLYLEYLLMESYNRGVDMDKFLNEFLSVTEADADLPFRSPIYVAARREDLELARIWLKYTRMYRGDGPVAEFINVWPKNDPRLGEFVRSLPNLDYNEILEYILNVSNVPGYLLVLELGGDEVDYVKLMNNDRFIGTRVEDALVEIITNQV